MRNFCGFASYPELYAVVGSQVPDYRGMFLRGYGSQYSSHYGSVYHSSGSLGAMQGDTIRGNFGKGRWMTRKHAIVKAEGIVSHYYTQNDYNFAIGNTSGDGWGQSNFVIDLGANMPAANEFRPVNKAVRYLIRAKP